MVEADATHHRRRRWLLPAIVAVLVLALLGAGAVMLSIDRNTARAMVDDFSTKTSQGGLGRIPNGPRWRAVAGRWAVSDGLATVVESATPRNMIVAALPDEGRVSTEVAHVVPSAGLVFRYRDPTSYWMVVAAPRVLTWQVCKVEGGRVTVVGNTGSFSTIADSTVVAVKLEGSSVEVFLDGASRKVFVDDYLSSATGAGLVVGSTDAEVARSARFARFAFDPS
jgi:hypothetical protein